MLLLDQSTVIFLLILAVSAFLIYFSVLPNDDCDGYTNGQSWEPGPCMTCSCVNDRKISLSPMCYVPCDNPIHKEGECCPTCQPIIDNDCDGHREGESWKEGPCRSCTCRAGRKICLSPMCHVPCDNPIHKEGECCPICPVGSNSLLR